MATAYTQHTKEVVMSKCYRCGKERMGPAFYTGWSGDVCEKCYFAAKAKRETGKKIETAKRLERVAFAEHMNDVWD